MAGLWHYLDHMADLILGQKMDYGDLVATGV